MLDVMIGLSVLRCKTCALDLECIPKKTFDILLPTQLLKSVFINPALFWVDNRKKPSVAPFSFLTKLFCVAAI